MMRSSFATFSSLLVQIGSGRGHTQFLQNCKVNTLNCVGEVLTLSALYPSQAFFFITNGISIFAVLPVCADPVVNIIVFALFCTSS